MAKHGLRVKHASGDADYDIAMAACASAHTKPVIVVASDTDILVLLLHHYKHTSVPSDPYQACGCIYNVHQSPIWTAALPALHTCCIWLRYNVQTLWYREALSHEQVLCPIPTCPDIFVTRQQARRHRKMWWEGSGCTLQWYQWFGLEFYTCVKLEDFWQFFKLWNYDIFSVGNFQFTKKVPQKC